MIRPVKTGSATIFPLEKRGPGSDDVVSHTLRHFVREGTHFDAVPGGEMSADEARQFLISERVPPGEIAMLPASHDNLARCWSRWDLRELVERVHDRGYGPRYLGLAAGTPLPGEPRSGWDAEQGAYWGGYSFFPAEWNVWICASWDPRQRRLTIRSARDRAPKVGDGTPRRPPEGDLLDELLRRRRR